MNKSKGDPDKKTRLKEFPALAESPYIKLKGMYRHKHEQVGKKRKGNMEDGTPVEFIEQLKFRQFGDNAKFTKLFRDDSVAYKKLTLQGFRLREHIMMFELDKNAYSVKLNIKEVSLAMPFLTPKAIYQGLIDLLNNDYLVKRLDKKDIKDEYWVNVDLFFNGVREVGIESEEIAKKNGLLKQYKELMERKAIEKGKIEPNSDFDNEKA